MYKFQMTGSLSNNKWQQTQNALWEETRDSGAWLEASARKIFQNITGDQCVKVICKQSHKITSLEIIQI
jgi:hypothetical protein